MLTRLACPIHQKLAIAAGEPGIPCIPASESSVATGVDARCFTSTRTGTAVSAVAPSDCLPYTTLLDVGHKGSFTAIGPVDKVSASIKYVGLTT